MTTERLGVRTLIWRPGDKIMHPSLHGHEMVVMVVRSGAGGRQWVLTLYCSECRLQQDLVVRE